VFRFELVAVDTKTSARAGLIYTDHGVIETPVFMPVGTQGTVKAVEQRELIEIVLKRQFSCLLEHRVPLKQLNRGNLLK